MNEELRLRNNRLYCSIDKSYVDIFFSLVDYRNNYFTCNDPEKIIEFYNGFENRDQLIQWMRERPKGVHTIHEVEGDKDIIVVIPTADFNGKFAKECRENIFNGLHIVFVESGVGNYYFNYAHNCNVGIKKAMEYDPKWVVVSNDDMVKISSVSDLRKILEKLNHNEQMVIYARESSYHSRLQIVGKLSFLSYIYYITKSSRKLRWRLKRKFDARCETLSDTLVSKFFSTKRIKIRNINDFVIFSKSFIMNLGTNPFDEIFINHFEDTDLSFRISRRYTRTFVTDFDIGTIGGGSLGPNYIRDLRAIPSLAYFAEKYEDQ